MAYEVLKSEELGNVKFEVFRDNEGNFIAYCRELCISTSGDSYDEAVRNFHEMFRLYIECCTEYGTLQADLASHGVILTHKKNVLQWNE